MVKEKNDGGKASWLNINEIASMDHIERNVLGLIFFPYFSLLVGVASSSAGSAFPFSRD